MTELGVVRRRIERAAAPLVAASDVVRIDNGGALGVATSRFLELLLDLAEGIAALR